MGSTHLCAIAKDFDSKRNLKKLITELPAISYPASWIYTIPIPKWEDWEVKGLPFDEGDGLHEQLIAAGDYQGPSDVFTSIWNRTVRTSVCSAGSV